MVSTEAPPASSDSVDPPSSPRISFSADFVDDPDQSPHKENDGNNGGGFERDQIAKNADFEFLSMQIPPSQSAMSTADELFCEGKLLPFCQMQKSAEKLEKISLKTPAEEGVAGERVKEGQPPPATTSRSGKTEPRIWLMDDDTSPRPPNCTVLWKELLRLKKQRAASSLSHSSSSSSSSSMDEGKEEKGMSTREKHLRRIKKGLERTRSASIRIRPMVNVPICTQGKSGGLPPLFPLKKGRVVER